MRAPALSVCVPSWNGAAHLEETLRSALAQSRDDFELLLVDDASTDTTVEIARSFAEARVAVHVNERRLGLPANWNHCLDRARGRSVLLLLQDDLLAPGALEALAARLDEAPGAVLAFGRREIRHEGSQPPRLFAEAAAYARHLAAFHASAPAEMRGLDLLAGAVRARRPLATNVVGEPSFVLLRREAALGAGGFDTALRQLADWDLWLRLGRDATLAFVDAPLGVFRVHAAGQSAANFAAGGMAGEHLRFLENLERTYGPRLPAAVRWKVKRTRWAVRARAWRTGAPA